MTEPLILTGLSVRAGRKTLLDDISATIAPGQLTAVVGPNGAGKSTLLRAIANILPSDGDIRIGDTGMRRLKPIKRARRLAYLPQAYELAWGINVADMVTLDRFDYGTVLGRLEAEVAPPSPKRWTMRTAPN